MISGGETRSKFGKIRGRFVHLVNIIDVHIVMVNISGRGGRIAKHLLHLFLLLHLQRILLQSHITPSDEFAVVVPRSLSTTSVQHNALACDHHNPFKASAGAGHLDSAFQFISGPSSSLSHALLEPYSGVLNASP